MNRILRRAVGPLLGIALAACATGPLPPARQLQSADLAQLGGSWMWTERSVSASRFGSGPIRLRVADGRLQFDGATSSGTLTLHEDGHRRVLRGQGRDKLDGRPFAVELTQRGSRRAATQSAALPGQFVFVVE